MMRNGHGVGKVPSEKGRRSSDAWWAEGEGWCSRSAHARPFIRLSIEPWERPEKRGTHRGEEDSREITDALVLGWRMEG